MRSTSERPAAGGPLALAVDVSVGRSPSCRGVGAALVARCARRGSARVTTAGERAARSAPVRMPERVPRPRRRRSRDVLHARVQRDGRTADDDPRPAVEAIADLAWQRGRLPARELPRRHAHGRAHVRARAGVTLANADGLPAADQRPRLHAPASRTGSSPAVGAGHRPERPREAARVCGRRAARATSATAASTGFGHAFMRIYGDRLGRRSRLCAALGTRAAPDCAQGAYHDYWFAVDRRRRRDAAGRRRDRPAAAVRRAAGARSCGRAGTARSSTTGRRARRSSRRRTSMRSATGLDGLQRAACVTAAAVIGPADPAAQLALCAAAAVPRTTQASCVRGTKVQNLLGEADRRVRAPDPPLRGLPRRARGAVLPLARQGARGGHGRRVRARRLPAAARRGGTARVCRRGAHDGPGSS